MKPVLYPADEKSFRTFGLGEIGDAKKVLVTRERNGTYDLYMEYPLNGHFASVFKEEMKIKSDAGRRTKWQTFEINRVVKDSTDCIKIYARHISSRTSDLALKPKVTVASVDAQTALEAWRDNLIGDDQFDVRSDIDTIGSFSWEVDKVGNARKALGGVSGSILDVFGGEYEFDNNLIFLHKQMGRKAPTVLEYGRNLISVEEERLLDGNYTSIYPFARYTPQSESEAENQKEILVTLPEHILDGDFLGLYAQRRIKLVDFSGSFDEKSPPNIERLRTLGRSYLKSNAIGAPRVSIDVSYIDLSQTLDYKDYQVMEEVELCDIIPLYYPNFGITTANEKVVKVIFDVYKEENEEITLGTIGQSFASSMTSGVSERVESLEKRQSDLESTLPKYLVNATGNRVWKDPPDQDTEHKIGDIWFEKNGTYDRMYIWNGNMWEKILDTEDVDLVGKKIATVESQIKTIARTNQESAQKAQDALDEAGAVKDLAQEAKRISEDAEDSARQALEELLTANQKLSNYRQTNEENLSQLRNLTQQADGNASLALSKANQTAEAMTLELSKVEGKIPTAIGGRNLVRGSFEMQIGNGAWSKGTFRLSGWGNIETVEVKDSPVNGTNKAIRITSTTGRDAGIAQDVFKIAPGQYTLTYWINGRAGQTVRIQGWWNNRNAGYDGNVQLSKDGWQRISYTGTNKVNDTVSIAYVYLIGGAVGDWIEVMAPKLEIGSVQTDASRAIEDEIDQINEVKTQIVKTAEGIETKITNLNTALGGKVSTLDFQSVRETAELYERIIGTTEGDVANKISRMALTSELFRSEIERKQSDSELIARMSDGVPETSNPDFKSNFDYYNIYDNRSSGHVSLTRVPDELSLSGYALEVKTSNTGTSPGYGGFWHTARSAKNKEFIIRLVANIPQGRRIEHRTNNIGIGAITRWLTSDIGTGQYETYIAYVKSGHSGTFSTFGHWNLADGPAPSPDNPLVWRVSSYQIYDISSSNSAAVKTQMTQLSDSWAVKALNSRGDVLSQINLAAGATSIEVGKNKFVVTTDTTYIKNGTIKSAMIADAQIGTAHIREIDASIARIINLDVSRITGLDADFIKAKIGNAIVEWLQGKRISATNGALEIDLNAGQINTYIDKAAIRRIASGRPTQFIKFQNHGNTSSRTTIGSNRSGTEIDTDGAFSGIRIVNGNLPSGQRSWLGTTSEDYVQAIGDHIDFTHSVVDGRGWRMITHQDNKPEVTLEPYRWSDTRGHNIYANNFYFRKADKGSSVSLLDVIRELSLIASHIKNGGFSADAQRSIALVADKIATFKIV